MPKLEDRLLPIASIYHQRVAITRFTELLPLQLTDSHLFILYFIYNGKAHVRGIDMEARKMLKAIQFSHLYDYLNDLVTHKYIKAKPGTKGNVKFYYSITAQGIDLLQRYCDTLERICKEGL